MGNNSSTSPRQNSSNQTPPPPHQPPPPPCYYPPPAHNYGYSGPPYAPQPPIGPNFSFSGGWYSSYHPATSSSSMPPGWGPQSAPPPPRPSPPNLQQNTKKIKNDVNVHKDSIRLEVDEFNPDQYLVSFVLDAMFDGSVTIYYFAKEEDNCKLAPLIPEAFNPVKVPFEKGLGQRIRQPSGTGIDLGFFALDELAKPSAEGDAYPLVISAEICSVSHQTGDEDADADAVHSSPNLQITEAVLETNKEGAFQGKVVKQILWIDGIRYELRELYGIANSSGKDLTDDDSGKECVICMTEPKDTAVMPCRHMCMCSECAKELRLQTNKCPICRQPITELIEIKLSDNDQ